VSGCTKTIGPADAAGLQELLDELPEGAVVCLQAGRYPGRLLFGRSVTLRGLARPEEVVLDAGGHGSVVKANASAIAVTLERLTVTGGAPKGGGGGVAWNRAADLVLREVVLRDNRATKFGGAGLEASLGTVTLERCRVEGNRAPIGAALLVHQWARLVLRDSLVANNAAVQSVIQIGGGAAAKIERSTVARNTGQFALLFEGGREQVPEVEVWESIVDAGAGGGALANDFGEAAKVTVRKSVLHGRATMVAGEGDLTEEPGTPFVDGGGVGREDPRLGPDLRAGEGAAKGLGWR
jgi:hypothetical protein